MAKKDTIAALTKRGINEETATVLVSKYGSMSKISEQGVEGLVASGLDEENAKIVINAIGKAPSRSSSSGSRKASSSSASTEAAPAVNYELVEKGYDMSDLAQELSSIGAAKGIVLPPKIYNDIAKKISNADPAIITPEVREKLVVTASRMFESHRMVQNESAGIMAAHSIGEPGTQMNLRTFHFAGDSFVSVTKGLPRLIEIVDAHAAPLTPSMTVPLLGLAKHDEGVAKHIVSEIAVTVLENVADIETDLTNVCLIIKPRPDTIQDKGITVDEIVESLSKVKALKGAVRQEGFNIVVSATEDGGYRKLQQMFDAARKAKIKGIDGIKQAFIKKDGEGADAEYSIITDGSNLKEILKVPYVDAVNVMTNSICEIEQVLGIEAARNAIVKEAYGTLEEAGLNIDIRHIMMVADLMTNDGTVRSIGRNGISGTKSSVLSRAAFEITAMHLLHAAIVGEVDNLNGVTENIIVGQPVALGTGAVNLSYAPEKIRGIKRPDVGTDAGIDAVADDDADMDAGATMGGDQ